MLRVHLADDVDRILVLPPSQGENVIGSTYLTTEYSLVVFLLISYTTCSHFDLPANSQTQGCLNYNYNYKKYNLEARSKVLKF